MLHHIITFFFFFNDTATTEIYTLSLHDALPIWLALGETPTYLAPKRPRDRRQNAHRAAPACGRFIARMATGSILGVLNGWRSRHSLTPESSWSTEPGRSARALWPS